MGYVSLKKAQFILAEFEKRLEGYSINEYHINDYEKVLLIEDSLVLYCGIIEYDTFQEGEVDFGVYIEELTYNTLGWKYNHTQFVKKMEEITGIQYLVHIEYKKFRGYTRIIGAQNKRLCANKLEKFCQS